MAPQTRLIDALPPSNRQKPMGVLALGFSRTGTMSLKIALEKLGYNVYHMAECARRCRDGHIDLFQEAVKAKLHGEGKPWTGAELDKVLQDYTAIEDIPCLHFVDELLEQYPDAKVILTTRDVESWEKSVQKTFYKVLNMRMVHFMAAIDTVFWRPYYFIIKASVDAWTNGDISDSTALRNTFTNHYAHIRAKVPKGKLLDFHPREGWEPLCEFLGHEAPKDESFPNINDAASTVKLHYVIIAMRLRSMFGRPLGVMAAVGIAYGVVRWARVA